MFSCVLACVLCIKERVSSEEQIIYKTEWTAIMYAYRNCVKLIQRIDSEYKFEILDAERKAAAVEGAHLTAKFTSWDDVIEAGGDNQPPSFDRLKTQIQDMHDAIFSAGERKDTFRVLYDEFSELLQTSLTAKYYDVPPLDPQHYNPIVYEPAYIKSKKDWLDCLVEMGKYIMYLEEYSVLHFGFTRFRKEIFEEAAEEERDEDEVSSEEVAEEARSSFGDDHHDTQMTGMLSRLNNL